MGNVNSADIKKKIVDCVLQNRAGVDAQFEGAGNAPSSAASVERNWKRISKAKVGKFTRFPEDSVERVFDCKPLEDQLRAYVITDATDDQILSLVVQGE